MEDEYKVVCALLNSAAFNDLEWPRIPVSRSQYNLKVNVSQTVHPIHSMFGSRLGFSWLADRMALFPVGYYSRWQLTAILEWQLCRALASAGLFVSWCGWCVCAVGAVAVIGNQEFSDLTLSWSRAMKLEQVANLLCAEAHLAWDPWQGGK